MTTAKEQLLSKVSPQAARLLDQQMRSQQVGQRAQGAGMLSGLVQAYTGMSDQVQRAGGVTPMGANELEAIRQQQMIQKQKGDAEKEEGMKRSVQNVTTAQFKGDPVEVLNKRIELLSRMVGSNKYAASAIQALEKRREELSITQADLALKGARTVQTAAETANTRAELSNIQNEFKLTDAQIRKIEKDIEISGLDADERKTRLAAEARKLRNAELNHTGQTSSLASYVNSRNDLSAEEKAFYIRQVASKGMKSSDVYDIIKPLSKKEKTDMALAVARTNKINAETGGVASTTIEPQHRTSFVNTLKDNNVTIKPKNLAEFLTTGDKSILIQSIEVSDLETPKVFEAVDSFVESLQPNEKQEFLTYRASLIQKPDMTDGQRAIKETQFLEKARQKRIESQFNATNASFKTIESNMATLSKRLKDIDESGDFSIGMYVAGEAIGFHLPRSVERSVSNVVKTLKSNAMLETMKELKRLSTTGATGLGATNLKEVEALEAKMRSLDPLDTNFMADATFIMDEVERLGKLAVSPEPKTSTGELKPSVQTIGGFTVVIED